MKQQKDTEFYLQDGMIDSHFHTQVMRSKGVNPEALLTECKDQGFAGGLDIGIADGDIEERVELRRRFPAVRLAAGLYPAEATAEDLEEKLQRLAGYLGRYFISAVGEMGIDLHWDYGGPQPQMDLMRRQIELANRFALPVIIHNRKADAQVLEVLSTTPPRYGGIMHCFSSGPRVAQAAIDLGLSISFAGNVTYKNSKEIREAAREVPDNKLLVETDSPFLSPQPVRGRANHPGHIGLVYRELAALRGTTVANLIRVVRRNFEELFPLSEPGPQGQA